MTSSLAAGLAAYITILAAAILIGAVATRLRVPYTVALVLVGLPFTSLHLQKMGLAQFPFAPTLLFVFLPALLFEAAWNLHLDALRRMWKPIAVLALPGVLLTATTIGAGAYVVGALPFTYAFLLGAIVSATDPIAVIATFRRLNVPRDLATIVEGESLANDAVAIVLYGVAIGVVGAAGLTFARIAATALWTSLGGILVGVVCALAVALVLRGVKEVEARIAGTVVLAFGSYFAADALGVSGAFSTLVAGTTLRALAMRTGDAESAGSVNDFWAAIAFLANSIVFLQVGITVEFERIFHEPVLIGVVLVAVALSRVVLAYGLMPLALPRDGVSRRGWNHVTAYAGLRGGLSLALALNLPNMAHRAEIIDAVFAVVLVTLVVQGWTVEPLIKRWQPQERRAPDAPDCA